MEVKLLNIRVMNNNNVMDDKHPNIRVMNNNNNVMDDKHPNIRVKNQIK